MESKTESRCYTDTRIINIRKFNQNNNGNKSWITNNVSGVNEDKYKENEKNSLISNNSNKLFSKWFWPNIAF